MPILHTRSLLDCKCGQDHLSLAIDLIDKRPDGCWWWTNRPDGKGYGVKFHRKTTWLAHRWVWECLRGRIPYGFVLDHLCLNKMCVNPDHLEVVTPAENSRRLAGGRWRARVETPRRDYRPRAQMALDDPRHGTTTGYTGCGCRCQPCRDAHAAYEREYRARRMGA